VSFDQFKEKNQGRSLHFSPEFFQLCFFTIRAGISRVRFHDLRHTAASLLLNNSVPVIVVSKILGHAKPSTTMDIYGHLINEMQEEAARIMDELVTPVRVELLKFSEKSENF